MMRIAIVEDIKEESQKLTTLLGKFAVDNHEHVTIDYFADGMDFISDYKCIYDIVFMDIEMPHMNGIDAAKRLREIDDNVNLVFVTVMTSYAVNGYEYNAVGYLVKPIDEFSFSHIMAKILKRMSTNESDELVINTVEGLCRIFYKDLYYAEAERHYVCLHTRQGEKRALYKMSDLEKKLGGYSFYRCNRGYIVNLRYVREVVGNTVVVNGDVLVVSKTCKKELLMRLNEYLGK